MTLELAADTAAAPTESRRLANVTQISVEQF